MYAAAPREDEGEGEGEGEALHAGGDDVGIDIERDAGRPLRAGGEGVTLAFHNLSLWDDVQPPAAAVSLVALGAPQVQPLREMDRLSRRGNVVEKGAMRMFLRDVTGALAVGRLTVIVGDADSGRTELLNVLSGRKTHGEIAGALVRTTTSALGADDGDALLFCQQSCNLTGEAVLPPYVTVRDHLGYIAQMVMPWRTDAGIRAEQVRRVLELTGLTPVANELTSFGPDLATRLTSAQQFLVGVAAALLSDPVVMFLHEPTRSLPAREARDVMACLQAIAASQSLTIVANVEHIDSGTFKYVDQVMLMHQGEILYLGDAGEKVFGYLEAHGSGACAPGMSPSEYFDLVFRKAEQVATQTPGDSLASVYRSSQDGGAAGSAASKRTVKQFVKAPANSDLFNFLVLFKRGLFSHFNWRRWVVTHAVLLLLSMAVMSIFIEMPNNSGNKRVARTSFMFMSAALFMFAPLAQAKQQHAERRAVEEEERTAVHSSMAYFLANVALDTLLYFYAAVLWLTPTYWTMPMWLHVYTYFYAICVLVLSAHVGSSVLRILLDLARNSDVAVRNFHFWTLFTLLFAGHFVRFPEIPTYWAWAYWATPLHWAFACLLENEIDGNFNSWDVNQRDVLLSYGLWVVDLTTGQDHVFLGHVLHLAILAGATALYLLVSLVTLKLRAR